MCTLCRNPEVCESCKLAIGSMYALVFALCCCRPPCPVAHAKWKARSHIGAMDEGNVWELSLLAFLLLLTCATSCPPFFTLILLSKSCNMLLRHVIVIGKQAKSVLWIEKCFRN